MKKRKIEIFIFFFLFILLINGIIFNFLNGFKINIFLIVILAIFKYINGLEKCKSIYTKNCILNMIIYILSFFILYYLSGLIFGFIRTENYYTIYGFKTFILNTIIYVILREILRYNILTKGENKKYIVLYSMVFFVILDLTNTFYFYSFTGKYSTFLFFALELLPIISNNILATFISKNAGYKPVILLMLVTSLYGYLLPITPALNKYIYSVVWLLFPLIIFYKEYGYLKIEQDLYLTRDYNKKHVSLLILTLLITLVLVYFTSGCFRYHTIAVASGSMYPSIKKGDIILIKKLDDASTLKKGDIIAFKYSNVLVVHRIINKIDIKDKSFIYTKGDNNKKEDNFVVEEEMIYGIVEKRIPKLGYPTVWINEA